MPPVKKDSHQSVPFNLTLAKIGGYLMPIMWRVSSAASSYTQLYNLQVARNKRAKHVQFLVYIL